MSPRLGLTDDEYGDRPGECNPFRAEYGDNLRGIKATTQEIVRELTQELALEREKAGLEPLDEDLKAGLEDLRAMSRERVQKILRREQRLLDRIKREEEE